MRGSFILVAAFAACILSPLQAVKLGELFESKDYGFYPHQLHVFDDGSLLVSAQSSRTVNELSLHSIVSVEPTSDPFANTNLVARVLPATYKVVWAHAISSLRNFETTTVDSDGNAYMLGSLRSDEWGTHISIIKVSPSGTRLWQRSSNDGLSPLPYPSGVMVDTAETLVRYASGSLYLPAYATNGEGMFEFHAMRFSADSGDYQGRVTFPTLEWGGANAGESAQMTDFGVNEVKDVMCFAVQVKDYQTSLHTPAVQCSSLSGGGMVTKRLEQGSPGATVFDIRAVVEEGERATVRVVYERAFGFKGDRDAVRHELVVHRLDVATLEEVAWQQGGKAEALVVRLPTPYDPTSAVVIQSMLHAPRARAVSVLLKAYVDFVEFGPENDGNSPMQSVYVDPPVPWVFSINERVGQMRKLAVDPTVPHGGRYNHLEVADLAVSGNEKTTYVYGLLEKLGVDGEGMESGPLYVYSTPTFLEKRAVKRGAQIAKE